jgi:thiol-disulfide isomerase/thioredoxin
MTIAPLLLALLTATGAPSSEAAAPPVLLDFHAEWCGPCKQVRPAVEQLIRNRYPVKSVDIDKDPQVAARYGVDRVPTFVVVDAAGRELDRTSGPQSASALSKFYLAAKAKAQPPNNSNAHVGAGDDSRAASDDGDDDPAPARSQSRRDDPNDRPEPETPRAVTFENPHPSKTVVRIKVLGPHSTGFGSGTIIYSSPEQSLILTCAHIFKLEGNRQPSPRKPFPRKIEIDLFDGKMQDTNPPKVGFLESVEGEAVDYDFTRDVGLIRIRPGRKLPASRVVPAHWEPKSDPLPMKMLTVGCSGGQDATAWYTKILNPRMQGLTGNPTYEAIECLTAPKEGRSGGGLFTTDFYVAGVCNFAEPRGNHGLYATPRSIYYLLDRNNLMALYAPVTRGSGTLVADNRSPSPAPAAPSRPRARPTYTPIARSQSPDAEELDARRGLANPEDVTLPHPSLLGIPDPVATSDAKRAPQTASVPTKRIAWHPIPSTPAPAAVRPTELPDPKIAPASDPEPPDSTDTSSNSKPKWRAVKAAPGDQGAGTSRN